MIFYIKKGINLIKKFLKNTAVLLGKPIYKMCPNFTSEFLQEHLSSRNKHMLRKIMQKVLISSISNEYYHTNTTTNRRMELVDLVMSKEAGVKWANYYLSFGFNENDLNKSKMFSSLNKLLSENKQIKSIHQVACSSGREIAFFASKFADKDFIGSDIDDSIINNCYKHWSFDNLSFVSLRLEEADDVNKIRESVVFSSGGLQYLDYATLNSFFKKINQHVQYVYLAEPVSSNTDVFIEEKSKERGNFSWNHHYASLLENSGWKIDEFHEEKSEGNSLAKNIYIKAIKKQN